MAARRRTRILGAVVITCLLIVAGVAAGAETGQQNPSPGTASDSAKSPGPALVVQVEPVVPSQTGQAAGKDAKEQKGPPTATVGYAMPIFWYRLYDLRTAFHPGEIGAAMSQATLYDTTRHRALPADQLKLLKQGGDAAGPTYISLPSAGIETLAVVPNRGGIRPGSYAGKVTVDGTDLAAVTVNVRHSITGVLLLTLLLFLFPTFLGWLQAQSGRVDLWHRLDLLLDAEKNPSVESFYGHLDGWIDHDLLNAVDRKVIEGELTLRETVGQKVWAPWVKVLDDELGNQPDQDGVLKFWEELRKKLQTLTAEDLKAEGINELAVKTLNDAKLGGVAAQLDKKKPTPAAEKDLLGAGLWNGEDPSIWHREAHLFSHAPQMLNAVLFAAGFMGALWAAYSNYTANPTFGADLFKDYGGLISAVLGIRFGKDLLSEVLKKLTGAAGK